MKDNFSSNSENYKKYRPQYPQEVYEFIKSNLNSFESAWDCGTGSGQVAGDISKFFEEVKATDISENQLKNAVKKSNIDYSIQPAEETYFKNEQFDLIISAQAVHWFEFKSFYAEVKRCLKPHGKIVIMGYGLFSSNSKTNKVIREFYDGIIGDYWDTERKYLDDNYKTIPFPLEEIVTPHFNQKYTWDIDHLLGYLRTWSAVKHYQIENDQDPVSLIEKRLKMTFGKRNEVNFPILFRMGKMHSFA